MRTGVRGDGSFTFVVVIIVFVVVFLLTLHLSCFNQKKSVSVLNLLEVLISSNGFCFPTHKSVLCCFKKLSFNNTLIRNTIKKSFMECSFCIWLARNKNWTPSAATCKLNDTSEETSSLSSLKQTTKPVSNARSIYPVRFINNGNTCYANSFLQILSDVPNLWNRVASESNTLSPMLRAISLNIALKKNSTKPVYPSNVLWALKRKLSIIRGVPFDFNAQQDVAELL